MRLALRVLVFALATLGTATVSHGLTIEIDPPLGDSPFFLNLPFSGLNGTTVSGQSLSLDFLFADDKWIFADSSGHGVLLMLQTGNIGPSIPDLSGTGSFIDKDGNSFGGPISLYQGTTNTNGLLAASLYSGAALNQINPIVGPFNYYGIHYDITLPTMSGHTITSAQLRVVQSDAVSVPDYGSSLAMLAIGILIVAVTKSLTL